VVFLGEKMGKKLRVRDYCYRNLDLVEGVTKEKNNRHKVRPPLLGTKPIPLRVELSIKGGVIKKIPSPFNMTLVGKDFSGVT